MVKKLIYVLACFILTACTPMTVNGYTRNPFSNFDVIWEVPVDFNSDEEQVFEVPYVKYAGHISICYDKLDWDFDKNGASPDSITSLRHDRVEISFKKDGHFYTDKSVEKGLFYSDYGCPVSGRRLLDFRLPSGADRETGGVLRFRVLERSFLKDAPNMRIVIAYSHNSF